MVPHREILRAIALVAHFSGHPAVARDTLCARFNVKFPVSKFAYFWKTEILLKLPPHLEAQVLTAVPTIEGVAPLFEAATAFP